MSRINHVRPQLRLLDNWRRELTKTPISQQGPSADFLWPPFLGPVAARPEAMKALFALINSISAWLDDESIPFSLSEPPPSVKLAFQSFALAKVENKYDPFFTGHDWLMDSTTSEKTEHQDFRQAILAFVRHA